jgi:hypothetical protein
MTSLAETVMVCKLRLTRMQGQSDIEQIFDVVNCPGIVVICISGLDDQMQLAPKSQTYEFGGMQYGSADDALLAWDDAQQQREAS